MPGSNPIFGLNTLGGALSLRTKDGRSHPGTSVQAIYGSDVRRALEFEHGGQTAAQRFHWYVAGNLFAEDGWRDDSPSDVRQMLGKVGWQRDRGDRLDLAGPRRQLAHRQRPAGFPVARRRLQQHLHQARHDRQPVDAAQRHRGASHQAGAVAARQRLLPRHPHRHAERRHQRGIARPVAVPADRRRARGAGGGRLRSHPGQRARLEQHAVSVAALHRQRRSSTTSRPRSATA